MAILPIRGLGDLGIKSDPNPYDLPINALSDGNNIRFQNGSIHRSPAFKFLKTFTTISSSPTHCFELQIPSAPPVLVAISATGQVCKFDGLVETAMSSVPDVSTSSTAPWTHTSLGNVSYINRDNHLPRFLLPGGTEYAALTYWPPTYRCKALRAYKSFLIALNITKGAVQNPTLIKWSDIALANSIPISWDETDTTKSAGENPLSDAKSPLLDGLSLRDSFILYCGEEVYAMDYIAGNEIFRFRKLYEDYGIINTNCAVDVGGLHYVFDIDDIYVHDGVSTPRSIIQGENHKKVFSTLSKAEASKFFVYKDEELKEISFCYKSTSSIENFTGSSYCNRAAVFNYDNGTWSFKDLPNVTQACSTILGSTSTLWESLATTWDTDTSTWTDAASLYSNSVYMTSEESTAHSLPTRALYVNDSYSSGRYPEAPFPAANKPAFAERIGVDLDEAGEQLRAYKVIKALYPQAESYGATDNIKVSVGASELNVLSPTYGPQVPFNPLVNHKVDSRAGGRYLAWRLDDLSYNGFRYSAHDVDVETTGRR